MGKKERCEFKIMDVSVKEMEEILGKIKPKTSSGPDGVSTKVLRTLKQEFAPIIAKLVNISTRTATFPKNLKLARVQPLYKGEGKKNEATNYRPISLLSCIGINNREGGCKATDELPGRRGAFEQPPIWVQSEQKCNTTNP